MTNGLAGKRIECVETYDTAYLNRFDIYQDGTVPLCRDRDGMLWGMGGHSHMGHIGMFCGHDLKDMKEVYPIHLNFSCGGAGKAFDGIRYPDGIRSRGSVWPFGLIICPKTNRFFALFHNESCWNGEGTGYDSLGFCEKPKSDSDFRHIGLMHSDDRGRNWTFDRWIMAAENICFTEKFNPDGINAIGQKEGVIRLGSGDFTLFAPRNSEFIYLFYNIVQVDMITWNWTACDTYLARARRREDGVFGDFVKYYDGAFCEAGLFGRETPVTRNAWHSRVAYSEKLGLYVMSSAPMNPGSQTQRIANYMELRTSEDLIRWSDPVTVKKDGKIFGNHYNAVISPNGTGDPFIIPEDTFTVMTCHNGTDVLATSWTMRPQQ